MEFVVLFYGLGNQMSQYAFYLSKKHYNSSCRVIFNPHSKNEHNGYELERLFGIKVNNNLLDRSIAFFNGYIYNRRFLRSLFRYIGLQTVREPYNYDYMPQLRNCKSNGILTFYIGGWHSEKYFKSIEDEIKNTFKFPKVVDSPEYNEWFAKINGDDNSVSLHIRRGDFIVVGKNGQMPFAGVCTTEYYKKAIDYIRQRVANPNFYVFSDDIKWCMETFGTDGMNYVTCNSGINSWRDMSLMSLCRHHINANSTFSWWAAWLSPHKDGITIRPKYFQKDKETKDFYPDRWIELD